MSPDDPRHGTPNGSTVHYRAGERPCQPCLDAKMVQKKLAVLYPPKCPSLGSQRRIQALQALGHGRPVIARALGYEGCGAIAYLMLPTTKSIRRVTAARIASVYDDLCMVVPTGAGATRARTWARRHGYAPPLAWDDIDRDDAPRGVAAATVGLDEVVVLRLLDGEQITSSRAEKDEAMRRWLSMGNSEQSLCAKHSWRGGRYGKAAS